MRILIALLAVAASIWSAQRADARPINIVALGDSNTAGFGVLFAPAFPALIEANLRARGLDVRVANQGISGDTTAGMLARLRGAVPPGTRVAIVQGGYNDKRSLSPAQTAANVDEILRRLRAQRTTVVLCGLSGQDWRAIARRHGAILLPGSACYDVNSRGFDGLHMNAAGHRIVAARLSPVVERAIRRR